MILDVKENGNGEQYIELPDELLKSMGWKEGDTIQWIDNKDGSYTMKKKETQYVLVETISTHRMRYVVEVPLGVDEFGQDKKNWALDTVVCSEAAEFSQQYLGETIVSHRVISHDEAIRLCDEDNEYAKNWSEDKKREVFFTEWKEADGE